MKIDAKLVKKNRTEKMRIEGFSGIFIFYRK